MQHNCSDGGPKNPVQPDPYRDEEVAYDNKAEATKLAATLRG
jgi:hypothetical protein